MEVLANEMIYSTGIGSNPQHVIVADFNRDNQLDIARYQSKNGQYYCASRNGNGSFSTQLTYSTGSGSNPRTLAIGNLNNDNYSGSCRC